ncbi:RNA-directed DNA polymerase, partial [Trifolium pratense]
MTQPSTHVGEIQTRSFSNPAHISQDPNSPEIALLQTVPNHANEAPVLTNNIDMNHHQQTPTAPSVRKLSETHQTRPPDTNNNNPTNHDGPDKQTMEEPFVDAMDADIDGSNLTSDLDRGAGAKARLFSSMVRDLCNFNKVDVLIIVEPRISGEVATKVIEKLGFEHHLRVDAIGFSGGIWLLWNDSDCVVKVTHSNPQLLHVEFKDVSSNNCWDLSCVYGSPRGVERHMLWQSLKDIYVSMNKPWLLMGDFNAYTSSEDKHGGGPPNMCSMNEFNDCVQTCQLLDLGFHGPRYTWEGRGVKERLDRALCNLPWQSLYPEASVFHLPNLKSDHRPVMLRLSPIQKTNIQRPFRFMANWTLDQSFPELVREAWNDELSWNQAVAEFKNKVVEWNKTKFGNIFHKKRRLLARIEGLDHRRAVTDSRSLQYLQKKLFQQYQDILAQEDLFWYQRARQDWIKFGDKNTRYFHLSTIVKKRNKAIEMLQNEEGEMETDPAVLDNMTTSYFAKLYKAAGDLSLWSLRGCFPRLSQDDINQIETLPLDCEIKEAIFSMGPLKSPGPDGLHPIFFQTQWSIVGASVCKVVRDIFADPSGIRNINETLLVLIPKVDGPTSLKQFRPISLCNVIYKVVTKIIATRMKNIMPVLIGPQQCSFIQGRQSADNIIIAQEVFHTMRIKKGSKGYMAVKVDLEKAYDRLRWEFVIDTLKDVGFSGAFTNLIYHCISSVDMQVLFNGGQSSKFTPSQGIRQGDPLSPYL